VFVTGNGSGRCVAVRSLMDCSRHSEAFASRQAGLREATLIYLASIPACDAKIRQLPGVGERFAERANCA
jgi:hypothetical protein